MILASVKVVGGAAMAVRVVVRVSATAKNSFFINRGLRDGGMIWLSRGMSAISWGDLLEVL